MKILEIKCILAYCKAMTKGNLIELPWFWNLKKKCNPYQQNSNPSF
jgi:hypothetical protein